LTPDNGHGAVYIAAACSTASPNYYSLGEQALQEGHGVAWVGALNIVTLIAPVSAGVTEKLLSENLRLGDVMLVGSMAWYDYSAIDPNHTRPPHEIALLKGMLNNDAHWIDCRSLLRNPSGIQFSGWPTCAQ